MPKQPGPPFRLKEIIWDVAATVGTDNFSAFLRDLDYKLEGLRKNNDEDFFENMPEPRTIQRIIELDIQRLSPEVVISKLPRHVWRLRNDYEDIKQLAREKIEAKPPTQSSVISPPLPTFNIGDLKIKPSPIGVKLVKKSPFMKPWEGPPFPAYADISIPMYVENQSEESITISDISYSVTINGNYAGIGSIPGAYTISPNSKPEEIDAPFRADFKTGGNVLIGAIMSKKLEIGITGTARYQSNSHSANIPFGVVIPVTIQLPFQLP